MIKVLYVDDEADVREIVSLSLQLREDIDVRTCVNADQAFCDALDWQPDLILTDLNMPGTDGIGLLAAVRNDPRTEKMPVVFLTALQDADELQTLLRLGALAVLNKPFDPTMLGHDVARLASSVS